MAERHLNPFGALHGGCTAAVIDVLGTSLIAMGNEDECGVAINLAVQYTSSAAQGDIVNFDTSMMKRGKRLAFVEVMVSSRGGRKVATGTVTKSLLGPK